MKRVLTCLVTLGLLAAVAGAAGAAIYPNATCPDTATITKIQDPLQTCHPAAGDTVFGIRGVVTAIDSIVSAFGLYMQLPAGGPYSGIDVFTGATNYQAPVAGTPTGGNVFYGDLIAVDGRALEFNSLTEVTDFDASQSTNDIVIRRLAAHGNPVVLPPYHIGTCLELDWVPGWSSLNGTANQEPWEACLVKVRGPLRVGRSVGTGVGGRTMIVSTPGGLDSIAVDGFALTNVASLANGATIDSVQGVLSEIIFQSTDSYRILLRSVDDLYAAAPPNVIDAYPVAEGLIRVVFDRPVTQATAENTSNYHLASFGTVLTATLQAGGKIVLLEIDSDAAPHASTEVLGVDGITSMSGLTMGSTQSRTFINGVLSVAEIQAPDSAGIHGIPCHDRSRYATATGASGTRLTFRGISTAGFGSLEYLEDAAGGLRSGLAVFGTPINLSEGHEYILSGQVQEFDGISTQIAGGMTEAVAIQYYEDLGLATSATPIVQTIHVLTDSTCDVNQNLTNAEDYEGVLVQIKRVRIVEERAAGQSFLVAGPCCTFPDTMLISNSNNAYTFNPDSMHTCNITGLLNFRNGNLAWRINPRNNADIVDLGLKADVGPGDNGSDDLRLAVSPNPSRTAKVSFALPKSGKVNLGVFDLLGRRVTTLIDAELPAGQFTKFWNGRDGAGNAARSGVYFYRLRLGDQLITTRAIKLD